MRDGALEFSLFWMHEFVQRGVLGFCIIILWIGLGWLDITHQSEAWTRMNEINSASDPHSILRMGTLFRGLSKELDFRVVRTQLYCKLFGSWRRRSRGFQNMGIPAIEYLTCDRACVE
jgi:hypothetical protein